MVPRVHTFDNLSEHATQRRFTSTPLQGARDAPLSLGPKGSAFVTSSSLTNQSVLVPEASAINKWVHYASLKRHQHYSRNGGLNGNHRQKCIEDPLKTQSFQMNAPPQRKWIRPKAGQDMLKIEVRGMEGYIRSSL